jgi:hypothetical protein
MQVAFVEEPFTLSKNATGGLLTLVMVFIALLCCVGMKVVQQRRQQQGEDPYKVTPAAEDDFRPRDDEERTTAEAPYQTVGDVCSIDPDSCQYDPCANRKRRAPSDGSRCDAAGGAVRAAAPQLCAPPLPFPRPRLARPPAQTRSDSAMVVSALIESAHAVSMLTGDAPLTAAAVARCSARARSAFTCSFTCACASMAAIRAC